jgi:hypothetical protein
MKSLYPKWGVIAHDLPEQRSRPDVHHRLRRIRHPDPHAHPVAAAEEHDLHPLYPFEEAGTGPVRISTGLYSAGRAISLPMAGPRPSGGAAAS